MSTREETGSGLDQPPQDILLVSRVDEVEDIQHDSSPSPVDHPVILDREVSGLDSGLLFAKGTAQILLLAFGVTLAWGSTTALVPESLADRYARLDHGYDRSAPPCYHYGSHSDKPVACQQGSDDAQSAAAHWAMASSILALSFNPVLGSVSDSRGRRPVLILSMLINCLPALAFLLMTRNPSIRPFWYFASNSLVGVVDMTGVLFAAVSDVVPQRSRARGFGLLMASIYSGVALGPLIPLLVKRIDQVAVVYFMLVIVGLLISIFLLPETTGETTRRENLERRRQQAEEQFERSDRSSAERVLYFLVRPFREVTVLNRNWTLRLVAIGWFFASMVFSCDATLLIYYIEDHLNFQKQDIAALFIIMGLVGVVLQGGVLQPLIHACGGEKRLLCSTFLCGSLHNLLYGLAKDKGTVYWAVLLSQYTKLNSPLLSSIASQNDDNEEVATDYTTSDPATGLTTTTSTKKTAQEPGRLQGALSAIKAAAGAIGPLSMVSVYSHTKANPHLGPGFMFLYASGLYLVGAAVVFCIPSRKQRHQRRLLIQQHDDDLAPDSSLEQLLIPVGPDVEYQEPRPR